MAAKRNAAPAPRDDEDDPVPENIDDFRNALARRIWRLISDMKQRWRTCGERCCKRARACIAPQGNCANGAPEKPMTPEQVARGMAQLQRMMRERVEQRAAEQEAAPIR